jgi:hypothetical protein
VHVRLQLTVTPNHAYPEDIVACHNRRASGLSQWLAIVLLVTVGLLPVVSLHSADDDPACTGPIFGRDAGPVLDGRTAAPRSEHCAVCHAMYSLRLALAVTLHAGVTVAGHGSPEPEAVRPHRSLAETQLPARAPPA